MPNGNDEWGQYKRPAQEADDWEQYKVKPTPAKTNLERAASTDIASKVIRGGALGAASGLGIPESTEPGEVVGGALKNVGKGLFGAAKELVTPPEREVDALHPEGRLTRRGWEKTIMGPAGPIVGDIARGVESAGGEAWKGLKERDPEMFSHGLGSALTQILTLAAGGEEATRGAASVPERTRLAKTSAALDIGKGEVADLKTAMPEIVKQAQSAGIHTVGDFGKNLKQARTLVDNEFNVGMAPINNTTVIPSAIARKIRNLVTPDMQLAYDRVERAKQAAKNAKTKTARTKFSKDVEQTHDEVADILTQAREYEQPQTYKELNAKRRTENDNLKSFYSRDTRAQAASPIATSVSKAIRDGAADIVYDAWDKANPGGRAKVLKKNQGALWALDDYVNHPKTGLLADLEARQLQHEGTGPFGRLKAHAYVSGGGPRAHLSGIGEAFSAGPMKTADATVRKAFGGQGLAGRAAVAGLPISVLAGRPTPFGAPPPPPEPPQ